MFFRIGYDSTYGTSCDAQNSREVSHNSTAVHLQRKNSHAVENGGKLPIEKKYRRDYSLSLDTPEDLHLVRRILEGIYDKNKPYGCSFIQNEEEETINITLNNYNSNIKMNNQNQFYNINEKSLNNKFIYKCYGCYFILNKNYLE